MAENSTNLGHGMQFYDTGIRTKEFGRTQRFIREAMEIMFHPDNMNMKEGYPRVSRGSLSFKS
jgi:hypothetical protein